VSIVPLHPVQFDYRGALVRLTPREDGDVDWRVSYQPTLVMIGREDSVPAARTAAMEVARRFTRQRKAQ
jgi:hypothetical protein